MIEVLERRTRTSKLFSLGLNAQGRERFALTCNIGGLHYPDSNRVWQDIEGSYSEPDGVSRQFTRLPYFLQVNDDSFRRIYPDRNDLSYWIEVGKPFANMGAPVKLGNIWLWDTTNAQVKLTIGRGSVKFNAILKNSSAPNTLTFPFAVQGITRSGSQLLHNGTVVAVLTKPTAIDANGVERDLNVTWQANSVRLSLNTAGLTFPVDVDPTIDVAPAATADDGEEHASGGIPTYNNDSSLVRIFSNTDTTNANYVHGLYRFPVTIPDSVTIDVAYLQLKAADSGGDDMNFVMYGNDVASPNNLANPNEDIDGRVRTTANVAWVANTVGTEYVNSPAITTIIQELEDSYDYSAGGYIAIICIANTDLNRTHYGNEATGANPANLYIEYTAGGGGTTATPSTINLATALSQGRLQKLFAAPKLSLRTNLRTGVIGKGFSPPVIRLVTARRTPSTNKSFIPIIRNLRIVSPSGNILRSYAVPKTALGTTLNTLALDKGFIPAPLNLTLQSYQSSLDKIITTPGAELLVNRQTSHLELSFNVGDHLNLILGLGIPSVVQSSSAAQIITPAMIRLLLQTYAPEILAAIYSVSVGGRYGVSPSVSNEGILTASGRYGGA